MLKRKRHKDYRFLDDPEIDTKTAEDDDEEEKEIPDNECNFEEDDGTCNLKINEGQCDNDSCLLWRIWRTV